MDPSTFYLIMIGMALWTLICGVIPPILVARHMQKKGEEIAKKRVEMVIAHAQVVLTKQFDKAKEDLLKSVQCSINGLIGNKVKDLKKSITDKMEVDAGPIGMVLGDAIGGAVEDYGYGKKKNVSNMIRSFFTKKNPNQLAQDQAMVNAYLPTDPASQQVLNDFRGGP